MLRRAARPLAAAMPASVTAAAWGQAALRKSPTNPNMDLLIAQESPRRMAGAFLYLRGIRGADYSASLLIMSSVTGDSGHLVMLKSR